MYHQTNQLQTILLNPNYVRMYSSLQVKSTLAWLQSSASYLPLVSGRVRGWVQTAPPHLVEDLPTLRIN